MFEIEDRGGIASSPACFFRIVIPIVWLALGALQIIAIVINGLF